jgi:hypothetical protein
MIGEAANMSGWPKYFGNSAQIASPVIAAVALRGIFYNVQLAQKNGGLTAIRHMHRS